MAVKALKYPRRIRKVNYSKILFYEGKILIYKSFLIIRVKPYSVSQYYDFYDYSKINSIR